MNVIAELNALSIRKPKPLSEAEIRDMVGAPTREEEEHCICGDRLVDCKDGYEHMTHGC